MVKKQIVSIVAMTLIGLGVGASPAYATISVDGQSGETNTIVGFTGDNIIIEPTEGAISLTTIPSSFNFGRSNQVSPSVQSINANNSGSQYVAATDLRTDKNPWSITAQASEMVNVLDTTDKITNATLQISGDAVTQNQGLWNATEDVSVNTLNLNVGGDSATFISTTAVDTSSLPGQETGSRLRTVQLNLAANQGSADQQYSGSVMWSLENVPNTN